MIPPLKRKCKIIPFFILFKYFSEKDQVFSKRYKSGLFGLYKHIWHKSFSTVNDAKTQGNCTSWDSKYLPIFA